MSPSHIARHVVHHHSTISRIVILYKLMNHDKDRSRCKTPRREDIVALEFTFAHKKVLHCTFAHIFDYFQVKTKTVCTIYMDTGRLL